MASQTPSSSKLVLIQLVLVAVAWSQHIDVDAGYHDDGPDHFEHDDYSKYYDATPPHFVSPEIGFIPSSGDKSDFSTSEFHPDVGSEGDFKSSSLAAPDYIFSQPTKLKSAYSVSENPGPNYASHSLAPQDDDQETVKLSAYQSKPRKNKKYQPGKKNHKGAASQKNYSPKYTQINPLAAYKKYSFQPRGPASYSAAPYNPNSPYKVIGSASAPTGSGCRKISHPNNGLYSTCYVCYDPKTKSEYQQCNEEFEPRFRSKREDREDDDEDDPYEKVKKRVHKYESEPEDFKGEHYKAPDFSDYGKYEDYRFGPEYFKDAETEEKSYSEIQSEELKKSGEHCKKVKKDSMVCVVCENPATGGNYEQCSYTSSPKEKKFAYTRERKFNSNDEDEDEDRSESKDVPQKKEVPQKKKAYKDSTTEKYYEPEETKPQKKRIYKNKPAEKHYEPEETKTHEKKEYPKKKEQLKKKEHPKKERTSKRKVEEDASEDDYFEKFFAKTLHKTAEKVADNNQDSRKEVEDVLAEFSVKDRTGCKKEKRGQMSCYVCRDSRGMKHEECAYISESEPLGSSSNPQKKRERTRSYIRTTSENESESEPTKTTELAEETTTTLRPVRQRIARRKTNLPVAKDMQISESRQSERRADSPKKSKKSKKPKKVDPEQESPEPETPQEFEREGSDGAFASELLPVFSKHYGTTLPKYMTVVTEYEKDFDEFSARG